VLSDGIIFILFSLLANNRKISDSQAHLLY
jgi:hypothetical protein